MVQGAQNYVLGRGEVHFAKFLDGTETPEGYRWLGNVSEFNLTFESEMLDHYASYKGIREKDASVDLQVNRTGTMKTDNINPDNIALFFFGSTSPISATSGTATAEAIADAKPGRIYQLGASQGNPTGRKKLVFPGASGTLFAVKKGVTVFTAGTDYTLDADLGLLEILEGGAIVDGDDLTVDYSWLASTRTRIISGTSSIEGSLKFISRNPNGKNNEYLLPKVKVSPNGDYGLIGEQWQEIPFKMEILKKVGYEALYIDSVAQTTP